MDTFSPNSQAENRAIARPSLVETNKDKTGPQFGLPWPLVTLTKVQRQRVLQTRHNNVPKTGFYVFLKSDTSSEGPGKKSGIVQGSVRASDEKFQKKQLERFANN